MTFNDLTDEEKAIVEEYAHAIRLAKHVVNHHHVQINDTDPNYSLVIIKIGSNIFKRGVPKKQEEQEKTKEESADFVSFKEMLYMLSKKSIKDEVVE